LGKTQISGCQAGRRPAQAMLEFGLLKEGFFRLHDRLGKRVNIAIGFPAVRCNVRASLSIFTVRLSKITD
jgi:hypothetical protein